MAAAACGAGAGAEADGTAPLAVPAAVAVAAPRPRPLPPAPRRRRGAPLRPLGPRLMPKIPSAVFWISPKMSSLGALAGAPDPTCHSSPPAAPKVKLGMATWGASGGAHAGPPKGLPAPSLALLGAGLGVATPAHGASGPASPDATSGSAGGCVSIDMTLAAADGDRSGSAGRVAVAAKVGVAAKPGVAATPRVAAADANGEAAAGSGAGAERPGTTSWGRSDLGSESRAGFIGAVGTFILCLAGNTHIGVHMSIAATIC